jgi:hypothetical protein
VKRNLTDADVEFLAKLASDKDSVAETDDRLSQAKGASPFQAKIYQLCASKERDESMAIRRALADSQTLADLPAPVLGDQPTRSEREITLAHHGACTCGGRGPGEGCPACEMWHCLFPAAPAPDLP